MILVLAALGLLRGPLNEACRLPRPEPRTGHQLAYDEARHRVLMFGGHSGTADTGYPSTLWSWDGAQWTCLSANGPPGRADGILVADPLRGVLVLYGGRRRTGQRDIVLHDTWEWNGTRWDLRDTIGAGTRVHMVAAFDARSRSVLLHGGAGEDGPLDDTWRWNGKRWVRDATHISRAVIANSLVARPAGALLIAAEDPDSLGAFRAILYEVQREHWAVVDSTGPRFSPQASSTMGRGGALLMFAGWEPNGHANTITWKSGEGWRVRNDPRTRRRGAAVAYDAHRNRVVMYGGDDAERVLADTWEWDGQLWSPVILGALVAPHQPAAMHAGDSAGGGLLHTRTKDVGSQSGNALVQELSAVERQAWDAWKGGDGSFYRSRLRPDAVYLSGVGRESREAMAQQTEQRRCAVVGYSLDSLAAHRQTADVALLTMHAAAEVKCGTRTIRSNTWGSTLFVKREGQWYITFHQETDTPLPKP